MGETNFSILKMTHRVWRLKLRAFLDGRETINSKTLGSHQDCELGKWLYATGMPKYSRCKSLVELEKKHKAMHAIVQRVVELKEQRKTEDAEKEFARIHEASEFVVRLLGDLEQEIKSSGVAGS